MNDREWLERYRDLAIDCVTMSKALEKIIEMAFSDDPKYTIDDAGARASLALHALVFDQTVPAPLEET